MDENSPRQGARSFHDFSAQAREVRNYTAAFPLHKINDPDVVLGPAPSLPSTANLRSRSSAATVF